MAQVIKDTFSANASSEAVRWPGGFGTFTSLNSDGGGTTILEAIDDDGNEVTMNDVNGDAMSYTAPVIANFFLAKGNYKIKVTLSGSTTPDLDIIVADERAG